MKKAITSLTLDDLFRPAPSGQIPKPAAPTREERELMIAAAAEAARAKLRQSPWKSTRLVLWMNQIQCACGHTHFSPSCDGLTVEFTHRDGVSKQYVTHHPSQANPNLPREIEYRLGSSECCHECWPEFAQAEESAQ